MADITQQATVNIEVNSESARRRIAELGNKLDDLNKKKKEFEKSGDTSGLVKVEKEIQKVDRQLNNARTNAQKCEAALKKLSSASPKELRMTLKQLQNDLNHIERGSKAWNEHVEAIKRVKAEIASVDAELRENQSLMQRANNFVNKWGMSIASLAASFTGLVFTARQAVQAFADMEAEEANVQKYTGMTAEQVDHLNEEFKKMDTRTSREELNKLAQEAGRLGLQTEEEVLGFVKAADIINVALDDLGEGATLTLSKLTDIFGDKMKYGVEDSMLKVGSVINELSQNCTASAPYLAQFTQRLAGVGKQANMTIPEIMGFAAVLDSQGQALEMSATALSQLIMKLFQDPAKIAKATGMDLKEFNRVLKEDTNQALIMLLEQLNSLGNLDVLAPVFDAMGTDGARASQVIAALAGNIEMVRQQQDAAALAFEQGTSVLNEYNIQNNTVQAQLDKAKKGFSEMAIELGQKLAPAMKYAVTGTTAMMRLLSSMINFLSQNTRAVVALIAAIGAYMVVTKAQIALQTVSNGLQAAQTALMKATTVLFSPLTAAYHLCAAGIANMTGNTMKARTEMAAFNAVCAANPIGAVVAALAAAAAAFGLFSDSASEATAETNALTMATDNAIESREREKLILSENIKKLEAFNGDRAEEKRLVGELNNKYGPILGTYKSVADWLSILKSRGDDWINTCYKQIIIEGKLEYARQLIAKAQAEREKMGYDPDWYDTFATMTTEWMGDLSVVLGGDGGSFTTWDQAKSQVQYEHDQVYEEAAKAYEERAKQLIEEAKAEADAIGYNISGTVSSSPEPSSEPTAPTFTPVNEKQERAAAAARKRQEREAAAAERKRKVEEERKKKRAEILEKEEFKDAIDLSKAELKRKNKDALDAYMKDEIDYREYLQRKHDALIDFYKDAEAVFVKFEAQDSKDAEEMRLKKEEEEKKWQDEQRKAMVEHYADERDAAKIAAQMDFYDHSNAEAFKNQRLLDDKLAQIDLEYHRKVLEEQKEGSKDYEKAYQALKQAERAEELRQRQQLESDMQQWLTTYSFMGAKRRMQQELDVLEQYYKQGLIWEEQYQAAKREIERKYRDQVDEATGTQGNQFDYAREEMEARMDALDEAYANGLVSEEDYQARRYQIIKDFHDKVKELVSSEGNEWSTMLVDAVESWKNALENLGETLPEILENIGSVAQATFAILNAGIQNYSNYANAARDLEIAQIEKHYDEQIKAAGNNEKKQKKLEEKKQADIAKVKSKYNKRAQAIEIAQAIASTAMAAINAYASAAQVPMIGYLLGPIAASMAMAAGALQIATIRKQHQAEEMGYAGGGFTPRDPSNLREAGVVHTNEFVANHQAVANPALAPVLRLIDYAQRNNTVGSLTSEDVSRALGKGSILGEMTSNQQRSLTEREASMAVVAAAMEQQSLAIAELNRRLAEGIESYMVMDGERGFEKYWDNYQALKQRPQR